MILKIKVNDLYFRYQLRVSITIGANLVIPAQICDELLCGLNKVYGQTDVSQYEQTHNMMQVRTGKLSELQLPVQNPAREGACTSISY